MTSKTLPAYVKVSFLFLFGRQKIVCVYWIFYGYAHYKLPSNQNDIIDDSEEAVKKSLTQQTVW